MNIRRPAGIGLLIAGFVMLVHAVYRVAQTPGALQGAQFSATIGEFTFIVMALLAGCWLYSNQGLMKPHTTVPVNLVCDKCCRLSQAHTSHCGYCGGSLHAA